MISTTVPESLSFLFKIDSLRPNFDVQPRQTYDHGWWRPSTLETAYIRESGPLHRWLGGHVQPVSTEDDAYRVDPQVFGAATVFTHRPGTMHLLAANCDAQKTLVSSQGGWRPLHFGHNRIGSTDCYLSYVDPEALHQQMPAPGSGPWMPQLVPRCYDWVASHDTGGHAIPPTRKNVGLIGKLPLLIALAAFSAPSNQVRQVITDSVQPNKWKHHSYAQGRGRYGSGHV